MITDYKNKAITQTDDHQNKTNKKIPIDIRKVEQLAGEGLNKTEICLALGIGVETLRRRDKESGGEFDEAIRRGKVANKSLLGRLLIEKALSGNVAAMIWLEKTRHGWKDNNVFMAPNTTVKVQWDNGSVDPNKVEIEECE